MPKKKKEGNRPQNFRLAVLLGSLTSLFLLVGFLLTHSGMDTWDSSFHLKQSQWLFWSFLGSVPDDLSHLKWYGPLWELILGFFSELFFRTLNDPTWVRYSVNFTLLPITLCLTTAFLIRNHVKWGTALLASALLLSQIRFAGHSVLNTKDFPFACAYLLCTLFLWHFVKVVLSGKTTPGVIANGTFISLVPYLIRPPVLVHFGVWIAFLGTYAFFIKNKHGLWDRTKPLVIALLFAPLILVCIWPSLWGEGAWREWLQSFSLFSHFFWQGQVRILGHLYTQSTLPIWYPFAWIPVIFHPLGFIFLVIGLVLFAWSFHKGKNPIGEKLSIKIKTLTFDLSLRNALVLFTSIAWGGILLGKPVIYDEERHIQFLYPPLALLAAFGLDHLAEKKKVLISIALVAFSLLSFMYWGRYSYVYKSPLIGNTHAQQFMGDYWGVCIPKGITALHGRVPPGAEIFVPDVFHIAFLQYARLTAGTFSRIPQYGPYHLVFGPPQNRAYYKLVYNRMGTDEQTLKDIQEGRAYKVWEDFMPPGDPACTLAYYPHG